MVFEPFTMQLKYHQEIGEMKCDLATFTEQQNRKAFRWVFEDIAHPDNFDPKFKLDPAFQRTTCLGWALSFFDSHESAKKRLTHLTTNRPQLFKKLGDHIAIGVIEALDGISNDPDNRGHFSHFEYENVVLYTKFNVIEKIA